MFPARLPDELIIEIFKDQCFSLGDLYRLALVSRAFLDPVRRLLYETVPILLIPDSEEENFTHSIDNALLSRTLTQNEFLRSLVTDLSCDVSFPPSEDYEGENAPEDSKIPTSCNGALNLFLGLAPNATTVTLRQFWGPGDDYPKVITNFGTKIRKLRACNVYFEELRELPPTITHLKVYNIRGDLEEEESRPLLPNLTHLDIEDPILIPVTVIPFKPIFPNLCSLKISLFVAATLDFSSMPHLDFLHLYNMDRDMNLSTADAQTNSFRFWSSLARSPSLRTLSFGSGEIYPANYETYIFSYISHEIPTLKTIRFNSWVRLDRIVAILDGRLAKSLSRFVIPSPGRLPNTPVGSKQERAVRAVSTLCEGTGIKVILAEDEEELWEVIDPWA